MTLLSTNNDALLVNYSTFVVAQEKNLKFFNESPFGIDTRWHIDPTKADSGVFLDLLQRLDALTFGPKGMPMDKWVFYNCAELPGFIYGFAMESEQLSALERTMFGLADDYKGPVPISMYIALPMFEPGAWFGHNLASLNPVLPERRLGFLATLTKSLGLKAYKVEHCYGATQWSSRALNVHSRYGPLDLLTAYTPVHSIPETLTYRFEVTDLKLRAAMGDLEAESQVMRPEPSFFLGATNIEGMQELQRDIEQGAQYQVASKPSWVGGQGVLAISCLQEAPKRPIAEQIAANPILSDPSGLE